MELSAAQQAAVTHDLGPLLIIAGAGTGKTTVLAQRIAHLITTKKAQSHEILAMTFTDKAAREMEARVDLLVPYGYNDVTLLTFHAFGDKILREYGLFLGLAPDYRILSWPEQILFFQKHLFDFALHLLRPLGNPTKHIEAILKLISRAKDEDVTPLTYLQYADQKIEEAAGSKDPILAHEARLLKELADTYSLYQTLMLREGCVDFGDQTALTLRLLRECPSLLQKIQSQFRYILVDEFQDTNYAQFQMVQLLAQKERNITTVGDDDQSIYKFRGAALSNMMGFRKTYPNATLVVLTENYRSNQPILDAAYRLIQHNNPARLEVQEQINKRLLSQVNEVVPERSLFHFQFDTIAAEADHLAKVIEEEVSSGHKTYQDYAILVRANHHADPFVKALNLRGVPYRFTGNKGLYRRDEVRLMISFLRSVADFNDSLHLYYLATSKVYHLPIEFLSRCMTEAKRKNQPLYTILTRHDFTKAEEDDTQQWPTLRTDVEALLNDLTLYLTRAREVEAGVLLYEFICKSGLIKQYSQEMSAADEARIQNIARFFAEIKRVGGATQNQSLQEVVDYIQLLIEAGEDPPSSESDLDLSAVSILTVHKAKGLEFDTVWMVGLADGRFPTRKRSEPLSLPPALVPETVPEGDIHLQEERRLFYVGMTRARRRLYLTGSRDTGGAREKKVSPFVLEALNLPLHAIHAVKSFPLETLRLEGPSKEEAAPPPAEPIPARLQAAPLSLTYYQMDDYLTCPLKYKYSHILKVPIYQHHTVHYGTTMHQVVAAYLTAKINGQTLPVETLTDLFERRWKGEGFLSRQHEEQRLAEGIEALRRFHEKEEMATHIPAYVEKEFSFLYEAIRINGRWDRIDETDDGGVVIDYKTSEILDQKTAHKKARENRQLTLYAWAYRERFGHLPHQTELRFLTSGWVGVAVQGEKEIGKLQEKISEVVTGLTNEDFSARPTYMACQYCAYQEICPFTASGAP